jgi:Asp-tRNA(Asn)/Glu-tRNA(Gln) amidotransferase A subunit family amidase
MVPLALGTDAGGSVRIPAAFCGIVGVKPSHGVVPRSPGFEEMRSVNVFGPLARSVSDARLCLEVISGPDPADNLSVPLRPSDARPAIPVVKDMTIAFAHKLGDYAIEPSTVAAFDETVGTLRAAGWQLGEARPAPRDVDSISTPIYLAELMGSQLDGREHLLGAGAQQMVADAAHISGKDYYDAQLRRAEFARMWESFFDDYDALLTPSCALPPFAADPQEPVVIDGKPHDIDTDTDYFTPSVIANLTGGPAVVVPTGLDANGLPTSIQVMTRRYSDDRCMAIAEAIEHLLPRMEPPV